MRDPGKIRYMWKHVCHVFYFLVSVNRGGRGGHLVKILKWAKATFGIPPPPAVNNDHSLIDIHDSSVPGFLMKFLLICIHNKHNNTCMQGSYHFLPEGGRLFVGVTRIFWGGQRGGTKILLNFCSRLPCYSFLNTVTHTLIYCPSIVYTRGMFFHGGGGTNSLHKSEGGQDFFYVCKGVDQKKIGHQASQRAAPPGKKKKIAPQVMCSKHEHKECEKSG